MFQNSIAAHMPKLQSSSSLSQLTKSPPSLSDLPGVGLLAGSTQHLKNLGKAVGAKVNDLLRRKETDRGDIGITEVNKNVASVLANKERTLSLGDEEISKFIENFPRLEPPPPVTKKRVSRALKTTQDMMISPNPVLSSPEKQVLSPALSLDLAADDTLENVTEIDDPPTPKCLPDTLTNGKAEADISEPTENENEVFPEIALSVPDLIHKESCDTNLRESSHNSDKKGVKSCISQEDLIEGQANNSEWSWPKKSTFDNEGLHPDLLSFE
ncbi:uncharacterized protein C1orf226 homolog [Leptodactylus fuscus]|uniref:uncharacterized protein C1orf226 homolog n=1 Tax=Leptodactylus fuscus TaxID=238119 RepID=UPI003F4F16E3